MNSLIRTFFSTFLLSIIISPSASAANNGIFECTLSDSEARDSIIEHVWGGFPDSSEFHERTAYVFTFNELFLVPRWAAWHAKKEYLDTPVYASRWSTFQKDPEISNVSDNQYIGWPESEYNLVRGHLVPYYISGGDRDNDGLDAEFEIHLSVEDHEDACTVFEVNSYNNIAPQYGDRFNSSPGLWWFLENLVRSMVDKGREFQIFAGTVFSDDERVQLIGSRRGRLSVNWGIGVPHGFFKIVVDVEREEAVGFLFDHETDLINGCNIDGQNVIAPSDCIVPIIQIEQATGLNFFNDLSISENNKLRNASTIQTWTGWLNTD